MEKWFTKDFEVENKNQSEEAMRKWRAAVSIVKNPRRRFCMVADLAKRSEAEKKRHKIQEVRYLSSKMGSAKGFLSRIRMVVTTTQLPQCILFQISQIV